MALPRITARCREDLRGIPADVAKDLVSKFIQNRSAYPDAGEPIAGLQDHQCCSLHSGRYRAVTWHEEAEDVVWLIAAGKHIADSAEDLYNVAIQRERAGRLYPTPDDYDELADDRQAMHIKEEASELRRLRDIVVAAREFGKQIYHSPYGLYAEVWAEEVIEELGVVRVRIKMRRASGAWIGDAELAVILAGPFESTPELIASSDWPFNVYEGYVTIMAEPS